MIDRDKIVRDEDYLFRVRKSYDDIYSQIGAFADMDKALELAAANPGYRVFDGHGTEIEQ